MNYTEPECCYPDTCNRDGRGKCICYTYQVRSNGKWISEPQSWTQAMKWVSSLIERSLPVELRASCWAGPWLTIHPE